MSNVPDLGQRRKINWLNVNTVLCAAVLIGAEVFGAAYAGGWAIAMLARARRLGILGLRVCSSSRSAIAVMIAFVRQAQRVEPFTTRE